MSVTGSPPPLWRSREERDSPPEARLLDEFPGLAERLAQGPDRRSVLKFMGAAMALGGMTACSPPEETILPYIDQPEAADLALPPQPHEVVRETFCGT